MTQHSSLTRRCSRSFLLGLLLVFLTVATTAAQTVPKSDTMPLSDKMGGDDIRFLLHNVEGIGSVGKPGDICVYGENAVPLIVSKDGSPVLAAAKYKKGRVVAFGHTGYLDAAQLSVPGTGDLLKNIVAWLAQGNESAVIAVVRNDALADAIEKLGFKTAKLPNLAALNVTQTPPQVIIVDAGQISSEQVKIAGRFVSSGGGVLSASTGWGWAQLTPGKDLKIDHTGNQLFGPMGLVWGDGMTDAPAEKNGAGFYPVSEKPQDLRLQHVGVALKMLRASQGGQAKPEKEELAQALSTVVRGLRCIPEKQYKIFNDIMPLVDKRIVPTEKNRVDRATQPLDVLAITMQIEKFLRDPARGKMPKDGVPALPAATSFPGSVPNDAKEVTKTVDVDTNVLDWHSTGLYAAPGEEITVTVPKEWIDPSGKRLLGLRIGCHKDGLWNMRFNPQWSRFPEITLEIRMKSTTTKLANPFGGLVYVTVPRNFKKGVVPVKIAGAIEAPLYVLGKTSPEEWKKIRENPAPWGELASRNLILTTRSENLRKLDDPDKIMEFWDKVMDACAEVAGLPLERERPERMVCDRQIALGYMHSGYPVMTKMDVQKTFVDLHKHTKDGWGFYHEFGHNHQYRCPEWTFAGTTEVTVNVFTMYVLETVCGIKIKESRTEVTPERRKQRREKYFAEGSKFETWKGDAFLALVMYADMLDAFGWDAYKAVFREYRALPNNERPKNDDEKRDQWMVRFSKQVGKNLGPYFDQWGVPVSQAAKDSIKDLPVWEPYK